MADPEKSAISANVDSHPRSDVELPRGKKYKSLKIGPIRLPWYASPPSQLLIVSFVCFLCPGMYNALADIGGGGQVNKTAQDNASTALYSTFAVVGFFAGTFTNKLGIKAALSFGGMGYVLYIASFLCYQHTQNSGFVIFAGAMLGVCAGLLWCAQGAIMMSYPQEASKGKYISWFWMIFNLGAVVGSLIPLGQNIHVTTNSNVNDGTYIGFLVLTFLGACLSWTLVNAKDVIRSDGSKVIIMKNPSWKSELIGLWETFKIEPVIILLFPMFWASNWFYTYQFNDVNGGGKFDTRTKALNGVLYWLAQVFGALIFGYCLDFSRFRRSIRARVAWVTLFILTFAIWGGGYAFQRGFTRENPGKLYDWSTSGYVGPMFLFIFYGMYDAAWQTCVYWFMGALTNNGRRLANYAGFYKGIQSAGAAVAWRLDGLNKPFMSEFASNWALLAGSLVIAAPLILFKIRDHVTIEEDLKFSDETYGEVAPTKEQSDSQSE